VIRSQSLRGGVSQSPVFGSVVAEYYRCGFLDVPPGAAPDTSVARGNKQLRLQLYSNVFWLR